MHPHEIEHREYEDFIRAGLSWADRREAELGAEWNDLWWKPWILSDRDVWYSNPQYHGPSAPHPEDREYMSDEDEAEFQAAFAAYYEREVLFRLQAEDVDNGRERFAA